MEGDKYGFVNKAYEVSAEEYYVVPKHKSSKLQNDVTSTKNSIDGRNRNFTNIANTELSKLRDDEFGSKKEKNRNANDNFKSEYTEIGINSTASFENNVKIVNVAGENDRNDENNDENNVNTSIIDFKGKVVPNSCNKYDFSTTEEIILDDVLRICKSNDESIQRTDKMSDRYENLTPTVNVENIYERFDECNSQRDTDSNSENFYVSSAQSASSKESETLSNVKDEKTEVTKSDVSATDISTKSFIFSDDNFVQAQNVLKDLEEDIRYRFRGSARSFKEKKAKWAWMSSLQREPRTLKESTPELNRSQYSLVSCGELTTEAVQIWLGLPEEVKYDPALAAFRQFFDKENGTEKSKSNGQAGHRLPMVKSAPHLNNNIQVISEEDFLNGNLENEKEKEDKLLDSSTTVRSKHSMFYKARHYTKMTLLLACWIFFTVVFLMYNEKEEVVMKSSISSVESKYYTLNVTDPSLRILVKLSGPFLSEQSEQKLNSTQMKSVNKMKLYLERWTQADGVTTAERLNMKKQFSKAWIIVLQDDKDLDFNTGEKRSSILTLDAPTNETTANLSSPNQRSEIILRIKTTANKTVPFSISYTLNPLDIKIGVIYACILLIGLYVLIIFEIINRTMAAVLVSTTSLAALALAGERPSVEEVVSWLDVETLLLLFSMMLLVAIMAETGMFDFLAVFTFEVTKGKLWPLITTLCAITALLSTFLDNVTTVLLMTPVTIRLCEVMGLDPIPILMSMVLFSNIGGTATPVGDPPNVIIASNKAVIQAGINFTNFTLHMTLGILLVCVQTYFQLRFIYRDTDKLRINVPRDIQDLRHQLSIWRRAADSLPHLSKDQHIVRERLERKMRKLQAQLEARVRESHKRAIPKEDFQSTLDEMKAKYKIRDKGLLIKSSVALTFVVAVFFLHSIPELNRVSLGWTALLGAILLLVLADREDLEPILHRVEWSTLLFFAALFVLMEALSKLGLIQYIGGLTEDLILMVDEKARLAVALLLMLWVSGLTSAFVDNIPLTTMMVRIVTSLGSNSNVNLPMAPLIWALSFGACLGGNGTLIGASANVVCAGVAEQHGYKFTFVQFFKIGFPVMIGHLIVASLYLMLCHCVFTWH